MQKILIVDDDISFCNLLGRLLSLDGYAVFKAFNTKSAVKTLQQEDINTILLDLNLPDGNGAQFTKAIKELYPGTHVIILTAHADITSCVRSIKNGADDYIVKSDDTNRLLDLIKDQFAMQKPVIGSDAAAKATIEKNSSTLHGFANIIGNSNAIRRAVELGKKVAHTSTSVLLQGETGTGKELFAQAIHNTSALRNNPFVAINCAAFSKTLLESELFGYKAGAFTGAYKDKRGLVEEADGGTLFLDEVGELHTDMQVKLLRVLEAGEFIKVGGTQSKKVSIRLISATNKDLAAEVEKGNFREDLLYRLNVFTIKLPPLREREDDVVLLADYFIKLFSQKLGKHIKGMTDEFAEQLRNYECKGNIRELKNIIERAVILGQERILTVDLLPYEVQSARYVTPGKTSSQFDLLVFERLHIQKVLMTTHWNKTEAARLLNISISTLYRKIEDYMLSPVD